MREGPCASVVEPELVAAEAATCADKSGGSRTGVWDIESSLSHAPGRVREGGSATAVVVDVDEDALKAVDVGLTMVVGSRGLAASKPPASLPESLGEATLAKAEVAEDATGVGILEAPAVARLVVVGGACSRGEILIELLPSGLSTVLVFFDVVCVERALRFAGAGGIGGRSSLVV